MSKDKKGVEIKRDFYKGVIDEIEHIKDFKKTIDNRQKSPTTQIVSVLMGGSIKLGSSDIHLEPQEKGVKIRIRVDGVLHKVTTLPKAIYNKILSRIKLLSSMKLNVTEQAQDGRFNILLNQKEIEIRASLLPSQHGESIVMRILDPENLIDVKDLGLRDDLFELFTKEISRPNGMIIVTGPTGSGKTTTLYAFLKNINNPKIKIITIENPVEYQLGGVIQTQVDEDRGYTFASGLESIVRQDPDVVLVGEIRNLETTNIALQAALTGHLVFSTLHTNDAAGTIARLKSLGASKENIAPAINLAIAQRLLRKVCPKCAHLEEPTPEEKEEIKKGLKEAPTEIKKLYQNDFKISRANPDGCKHCNFTGYKGRVGIFEALLVNDKMENLINQSATINEIRKEMESQGMLTLYQDGLVKVLKQKTTFKELSRVTQKD